jgi:hypothetical protein
LFECPIFERVDVVEFAGLDERSDGGPVFGAAIRSREQRIFPVERDGADGAFDGIVVEKRGAPSMKQNR